MHPFELPRYFYDQRRALAEDAGMLRRLIATVDSVENLAPPQWAHWYGVTLGFQPDLILELGRGRGNSTALFCLAAARLPQTRIVSVCLSADWIVEVAEQVEQIVGSEVFSRLDARIADIATVDYEQLVANDRRVLVLWDAHGFEIAEIVLGRILPAIVDREHLVLMHDISDNRYTHTGARRYPAGIWKPRPTLGSASSVTALNIGWMRSVFEQIIPLADFSARNDIEIGSGEHEFRQFFAAYPQAAAEMVEALGPDLFSLAAQWAFLSLAEKPGPWHFPNVASHGDNAHSADVSLDTVDALPVTLSTTPIPWTYAGTFAWTEGPGVPSDRRVTMCVRVHVEEAPVGIGVLNKTGSEFIDRKAVAPDGSSAEVVLNLGDPREAGLLVVQTWGVPASGRVRIDAVSLVW